MLAVAIDHGESFHQYLANWNIEHAYGDAVRLRIGACTIQNRDVDALVLSDHLIRSALEGSAITGALWLGLDDYTVKDFPDGLAMGVDFVIDQRQHRSIMAVKVGVHGLTTAEGIACERVVDAITAARKDVPDVRLVIEPYFTPDDNVTTRMAVLDTIDRACPGLYFKLDYFDGNDAWFRLLEQRVPRRWALRSAGMSFPAFVNALQSAVRHGCDGAIVGTALWADLGGRLWRRDDAARAEIKHRLNIVAATIARLDF